MLSRDEHETLIAKLDTELTALYRKKCYGAGVDRSILHPPATPKEVSAFERKSGIRLPPSYKDFLRLHNGWEHFWFDMTLIGVGGEHTAGVLAKVKETVEYQKGRLTSKLGELTNGAVQKWERQKRSNLYLADHWCFATSFAGEFFVFDRRTLGPDGEMEVVFWNIGSGADDDERYNNFADFLEKTAERVEAEYNKAMKSKAKKKK